MNGKQLFDVGARLLGLWFVVSGAAGVPALITLLTSGDAASATSHSDQAPLVHIRLAGLVILIASGFLLLIRHRLPSDASALARVDSTTLTIVGLRLLGMSMAIPAAISLIEVLLTVLKTSSLSWLELSFYLKPTLTTACGLVLILHPEKVVVLITRYGGTAERPATASKEAVASTEDL